MVISQRNAGASVTLLSSTYTLDRWLAGASQTSKYSIQQNAGSVTPPVGFTNYLGVTSLSSYSITSSDFFGILQKIEGFNVSDFAWGTANAAPVTLSFWVRSSLTGTFGGSFQNNAANRSYPFSYTISSANTWEQKSITVAGDTSGTWLANNSVGIQIAFGLGYGSTYSGTAGAWAAGNFLSATGATSVVGTSGATLYITGVQLEKGTTATSFDYRPYGTELQLCQRYYEVVGAAIGGVGDYGSIWSQPLSAFTNCWTPIRFAVPKRIGGYTFGLTAACAGWNNLTPNIYSGSAEAIIFQANGYYYLSAVASTPSNTPLAFVSAEL
jgi:hypothetical protein